MSLIAHCELLIKLNCEWNKPSPILIIVNIISDVNVETGSWYGNSVIVLRSTKQVSRFRHHCVAGTVFIYIAFDVPRDAWVQTQVCRGPIQ